MTISEIPKFIINLKRRPDRLKSIIKEMDYMGWEYEIFEAVDTGNYMGCTLSHLEIFEICKSRGYDKVMIIEDDTYFMPYAKDLISKVENELDDFDYLNFGPTLNRKVNKSENHNYLLDLKNLPPKENEQQRGIYNTNCVIYDKKLFNEISKISETKFQDGQFFYAIDDFIYQKVMSNFNSYCPVLPITTQGNDYSDVSHNEYNNFYTITYNWVLYSGNKIPQQYLNLKKNLEFKDKKEHYTIEI